MESAFKRVLTNRNPKFEFLLEKKLAFPCQARVSEPRFGYGFPKVPEERYRSWRNSGKSLTVSKL